MMEILALFAKDAVLAGYGDDEHHGLYLTLVDAVDGEPLPSLDRAWLALAPFERSSLPADRAAHAEILRQRMKLLEVLVRLSMTRRYDWQTAFSARSPAFNRGFCWNNALRRLHDTTSNKLTSTQAAYVLRWGHPRLLLALGDDPVDSSYPDALAQLLSGVADDNELEWRENADFRYLLDEEEQLDVTNGRRAVTRHRVVELGIEITRGEITTALLHRIIDVLEEFQHVQQKRHDAAVARGAAVSIEFRVTALRFDVLCALVSSALAQLGDRINELRFLRSVLLAVPWKVETRSLQQCLSKMVRAQDAVEHGPQVRPLRTLSVKNGASSFASLGAAVRYPCAVRGALDVTYQASDMALFAAWLAFGLFHVDSASQVSTLRVRMPGMLATVELRPPYAVLSPEWIQVFKRVLSRVVASEDLAPITVSSTSKRGKRKHAGADDALTNESPLDELELPQDRRVIVTVRAKTKAFVQPNPRSELVAVLAAVAHLNNPSDAGVTRFQVIRKLRAWLALAVPGAGAGWIRADAVISEETLPTKLTSPTPLALSRVTSLAWVGGSYPIDDELKVPHVDALLELLAIIGEPLEELHLPWMALHNHHISEILRCCPNLRELNIANNELTDIAPLVEAFETGTCKITSLNVGQYGKDNNTIIQQTARIAALGAATLERLVVRITRGDATTVTSLRDALSSPACTALEYVCLHCDDLDERDDYELFEGEEQSTSAQVRALFADVLVLPARCSRPLALRSKLAMLSVWRSETTSSALSQLDRGVLSTILQFARTNHARSVEIVGT